MTDRLVIALAQINPVVGDIPGNIARLGAARREATGADLVVASELVVSGYPPEDLVLKPVFLNRIEDGIRALAAETADGGPALLVGAPWRIEDRTYNAALLLDGGEIAAIRLKHDLPNYGVFDEKRVFAAGPLPEAISFRDVRLGIMVCEDMWMPEVTGRLSETGAELLVVLNSSPFATDKAEIRVNLAVARVVESGLPLLYVNQVGGQDELVFDGGSFVLDADRRPRVQMPAWSEAVLATEWRREQGRWRCATESVVSLGGQLDSTYRALVLGLRDYIEKNGFPGALIGLSGGIDSALTAAVAVDALGPERVHWVMMPSPYTSQESLEDAAEAAQLLGARLDTVAIEPAMQAFETMLGPLFAGRKADETEENIQARARGMILMAISNKLGHMVVSTGNKSEMSVGYATLYGDMCGGYGLIKDVYKTSVFALCDWRNRNKPEGALGPEGRVVPERILTKKPSAELKPDQFDEDTLPAYETLDAILKCLIEEDLGPNATAKRGFDAETVDRVWRMLENAEYKRRQAAPGVKITSRSFGRDRRYPITNAFKKVD
ncbi:MAG: NAD+ synthase [Alphaproteobacteria bacterium]